MFVHSSVRPVQVCLELEQSIFIFLGQRAIRALRERSESNQRSIRVIQSELLSTASCYLKNNFSFFPSHALLCNFLTTILRPNFEKPIDTFQQALDKNMILYGFVKDVGRRNLFLESNNPALKVYYIFTFKPFILKLDRFWQKTWSFHTMLLNIMN